MPWDSIPLSFNKAIEKYTDDSLQKHGIAPWWIQTMMSRLTRAFSEKDKFRIIKLSAELGHYVADLHVPLHAHSNHNGQHTNQHGIHGFWESRIPELLAEKEFDFIIGKAAYINSISFGDLESRPAKCSICRYGIIRGTFAQHGFQARPEIQFRTPEWHGCQAIFYCILHGLSQAA